MKRSILTLSALLATTLAAQPQGRGASTSTFVSMRGEEVGEAKLTATPSGVLIELDLSGFTPESWASFHIHESGTCDPGSSFESAGGHFNPQDADHGFLVDGGPHAGDMPN